MAELKKLVSEIKDDDAFKKTLKEMWDVARKTLRTPFPIDLPKHFENMPPSEASILKSILKTLSDSGKSQEDSSAKNIKLQAKIKKLNVILVIQGIAIIALAIFSLFLR